MHREIDVEAIARTSPRAVLVDLDGTLVVGQRPVRGATELLACFGEKVAIITNNSAETPTAIARWLRTRGLDIKEQQVFSAGARLVETIAERWPGGRVLSLASPTISRLARARGLLLVDNQPDVVMIGRDRAFNYKKMASAANAIANGATLLAANPDTSHPGPNGSLVPETGAVLAALLAICQTAKVEIIGKPSPGMALDALAYLGSEANTAVVVGDNTETDGRLAKAIGANFIPVNVDISAPQ